MIAPRTMPHSVDAEQAGLGALMLSPQAWERVAGALKADDFFRGDHRQMFAAMRKLLAAGKPCDAITLGDELASAGLDEATGGMAYAVELANSVPSAANVTAYAAIVADKARLRRVIAYADTAISAAFANGAEPNAVMDMLGSQLSGEATTQGREAVNLQESMREAFADIRAAFKRDGLPGITTGLAKLDDHMGGWQESDLTFIQGRTSSGKTAFLVGAARAAAMAGYPVAFISAEMPAKQIAMRCMSQGSGVSVEMMRRGKLQDADWTKVSNTVGAQQDLPIHIYDEPGASVESVVRWCRKAQREHGIKIIFVDYVQILGTEAKLSGRIEHVGHVGRQLKFLARHLNVPVVALAQTRREVDRGDGRPALGDMCDSSELEKVCDTALSIFRETMYTPTADPNRAEIIVTKNRHGGTGVIDVRWIGSETRFATLDRDSWLERAA